MTVGVPGPYSGTGSPLPVEGARRGRHALKTQPDTFSLVWGQHLTYDVRRDDRGFHEGDTVLFREWIPANRAQHADPAHYTGREVLVRVGTITRGTRLPTLLARDAIVFEFEELARCTDYDLGRSMAL